MRTLSEVVLHFVNQPKQQSFLSRKKGNR